MYEAEETVEHRTRSPCLPCVFSMRYALRQKEELNISMVVMVIRCDLLRMKISMNIKPACLMTSLWLTVVGKDNGQLGHQIWG
jgi:hypothetical protein